MLKVASEASQVLVAKVYDAGHEHILDAWHELDAQEQNGLLDTIDGIDFQLVNHLQTRCLKSKDNGKIGISKPHAAVPVPLPKSHDDVHQWKRFRAAGEKAIAAGEVAIFMAAGEHSPSSDFSGPKALYPVGPISQKSLIQLQCEKVASLNKRHNTSLLFMVMTDTETARETTHFLKENQYFTLPKNNLMLLEQPRLPLLSRRGKIVMKSPAEIAMAPNGHGGAFLLMQQADVLDRLRREGVKYVYYFQADNPCAQLADPAFVGLHALSGADISAKSVVKLTPNEPLGIFSQRGDNLSVIPYEELRPEDRSAKDADTGQLRFSAANVGIHIFSVDFLQKTSGDDHVMPYHPVEQREGCLGRDGKLVRPATPNCTRFECNLYDVFPWARQCALMEADRREEFFVAPVRTGQHRMAEARRAMSEKYAYWLESLGLNLPRDKSGRVLGAYEISPTYALNKGEFLERCHEAASFVVGDSLYLE